MEQNSLEACKPRTGNRKKQFCVTRLARIPETSRASLADLILAQTHQPVRITEHESLADLNIFIGPQPFPRRFPSDNQVVVPNHLRSWDIDSDLQPSFWGTSQNMRSASRGSTAILEYF